MFPCPIDNSSFETREALHSHLKTLRVKQSDFYREHYGDRRDKLTGNPIDFKNVDFYLHSYFNSRANLIEYFKKNPNHIDLIIDILVARKQWKGLTSFPSTFESRTSIIPSPFLIESLDQSLIVTALRVGLPLRFDYSQKLEWDNFEPLTILVDSREQQPLEFSCETSISKLDVGDYVSKSHFANVVIDRKSLNDLCGTISQGYERFIREIERARELGLYLVVLVEEKLQNLLNMPFLPASKHVKASPDFICSRARDLCQKYDNIQFCFADGRRDAAAVAERIFLMKNPVKTVDLQYFLDKKAFLV